VLVLVCLFAWGHGMTVPVADAPAPGLESVDLGMTVFSQDSAKDADQTKDYVIFAFDADSCAGEKKAKCDELEKALFGATKSSGDALTKYKEHIVLGKANKDDFPDHKSDLEQAKVPLPAVLFWPAGHSRPSCKFDSANPTSEGLATWLVEKLKDEEDDDLLQLDEGEITLDATPLSETVDETSALVCHADKAANAAQDLVQLEKTQKIWDAKTDSTKFLGPADNSLSHDVAGVEGTVKTLDAASYKEASQSGNYVALYFTAPWCQYCECLDPVWNGVSGNLVSSNRQPHLTVAKVNGDESADLRALFNVTVYPTFLLVNKEGSKVLGRYLGPRKVFELSTWVEDLIVADENPVVKHQFDVDQQGEHTDMHPVYPYTGPAAFGEDVDSKLAAQNLASLETGLGGNDFDECVDSDERKFTAPGVALLVHYPSDPTSNARSLEMDTQAVSVEKVPEKLMVVDFYAPWCPHCQKLNPVWDSLATQTGENVMIGKVDMEAHTEIKKQFGIHRFPTIMFFEPGKKMSYDESRRYTGKRDVEHLQAWIAGLQSGTPPAAQKAQPQAAQA